MLAMTINYDIPADPVPHPTRQSVRDEWARLTQKDVCINNK